MAVAPRSAGTEVRVIGALFLAAFVCYGVGSALAEEPVGVVLVLLNSLVVLAIGGLVAHLFAAGRPWVAATYLFARTAEAVLLAVGLAALRAGSAASGQVSYEAAMLLLGLGSVPLCVALGRDRVAPRWLMAWGAAGYALLAAGAAAELFGRPLGLVLAAPGGLFEVAVGVLLIARGATWSQPMMSRRSGAGPRAAAAIAGAGLLLMAGLAGWANFAVIESLPDVVDPETTQRASVALGVVAALDVVVALALYRFLAPADRALSGLAAGARVAYAAWFVVAIAALARGSVGTFGDIWQSGLLLFGIHLLLTGWVLFRSRVAPRWIGVLVVIAGLGYLVDAVAHLLRPSGGVDLASVTFVGEVVLLGWLLWVGVGRSGRERRQTVDVNNHATIGQGHGGTPPAGATGTSRLDPQGAPFGVVGAKD